MDKKAAPPLFVNDGSFMEKFKQLQKEKVATEAADAATEAADASASESKSEPSSLTLKPNASITRVVSESKTSDSRKLDSLSSNGKLAFSLRQKSKLAVAPVKLIVDEEEDEEPDMVKRVSEERPNSEKRLKLAKIDTSEPLLEKGDVAPCPPADPTVKNVADKLASFVAKNGRQYEHMTRQRNPGDSPFKFLFDTKCADYKYYQHQLIEEEKLIAHAKESQVSCSAGTSALPSRASGSSQRSQQQHSNYQIPASALYDAATNSTEACSVANSDPIAMMEYYMKRAAQEERMRAPKQSKDEMPPPASLAAPVKKGHHMGDYIPQEELEKFLASCNDAAAQKAAREAAENARIQADNVGHKLLSKMGWKEGEGLGSSRSGRADPVMAGQVKKDHLGVGAVQPGEVTPEDDIYEQYKKRMMLGYRYRPNPLKNPRKAYY